VIVGRYVKTFAEADMGMLQGANLNAPYKFHWLFIKAIEGDVLVCTGGSKEMRLPIQRTSRGDRTTVTVQDPIFGPVNFVVLPFRRNAGS